MATIALVDYFRVADEPPEQPLPDASAFLGTHATEFSGVAD